jgi:hypothetical protein
MSFPPPRSGVAIRAWRALGVASGPVYVDWAVHQLEEGRDGPNLRILAGLHEPFDYYFDRYLEGALAEVGIGRLNKEDAITAYSREIAAAVLEESGDLTERLSQLKDLCLELDYAKGLIPFHSLYYALDDLRSGGKDFYWEGANLSNIDEIVRNQARLWLAKGSGAA